jgi:hypothetical protein
MNDHYLTALLALEAYWAEQSDIDANGNPNVAMEHLIMIRERIAERQQPCTK